MVDNNKTAHGGGKKLWMIIGIICVVALGGWLFAHREKPPQQAALINESIPQTVKDKIQPTQLKDDSTANQEIVAAYISNFLKQGYAKYYVIQEINHRFVSQQVKDGQLEAVVMTTMKSRPKNLASNPDTVPYIKEAKTKAQQESDPDRKKMLEEQYATLKREYGRVDESNFSFKLTAHLDGEMIDEESIKLYYVQDAAPNHTEYRPAEEILPK